MRPAPGLCLAAPRDFDDERRRSYPADTSIVNVALLAAGTPLPETVRVIAGASCKADSRSSA